MGCQAALPAWRRYMKLLGSIHLVLFLEQTAASIISPQLSIIAIKFCNASSFDIGRLWSVYFGSQLLSSAVLGHISDRCSHRWVLCVALLMTTVSQLITSLSVFSLNELTMSRVLVGLSCGTFPVYASYVTRTVRSRQVVDGERSSLSQAIGNLSMTSSVAYVVGPLIVALIVKLTQSDSDSSAASGSASSAVWKVDGFWLREVFPVFACSMTCTLVGAAFACARLRNVRSHSGAGTEATTSSTSSSANSSDAELASEKSQVSIELGSSAELRSSVEFGNSVELGSGKSSLELSSVATTRSEDTREQFDCRERIGAPCKISTDEYHDEGDRVQSHTHTRGYTPRNIHHSHSARTSSRTISSSYSSGLVYGPVKTYVLQLCSLHPLVYSVLLVRLFFAAAQYCVYTCLPRIQTDLLRAGQFQTAILGGVSGAVAGVFQSAVFPALVQKLGPFRVFMVCGTCLSIGAGCIYPLSKEYGYIGHVFSLILLWFGLGILDPAIPYTVAKLTSERQVGMSLGVASGVKAMTALMFPAPMGLFFDKYPGRAMLLPCALACLGVILSLVSERKSLKSENVENQATSSRLKSLGDLEVAAFVDMSSFMDGIERSSERSSNAEKSFHGGKSSHTDDLKGLGAPKTIDTNVGNNRASFGGHRTATPGLSNNDTDSQCSSKDSH